MSSQQQKIAVVSLDGINLSSRFILKELSIRLDDESSCRHYVFKKPADLVMTLRDRKTERYARKVLGAAGLDEYNTASLDYYSHITILSSLHDYTIYCAGHVAFKFLASILPTANLFDIQEVSAHVFPKELPHVWCGLNHNPRYCSLAKLWNMVTYIDGYMH